uniref:Uncharacterized protein n=1 Tax=Ralstonia syzygii R24 TaxID=907261 RepID=G3A284_9RALS|nr:hypothetical protein RALSY_20115 [Ralstonia syzygii R24]
MIRMAVWGSASPSRVLIAKQAVQALHAESRANRHRSMYAPIAPNKSTEQEGVMEMRPRSALVGVH